KHWGETGGTLGDKDKEIRVRMGKFTKQPWSARGATTGVFSKRCVGNKGLSLAPRMCQTSRRLSGDARWHQMAPPENFEDRDLLSFQTVTISLVRNAATL